MELSRGQARGGRGLGGAWAAAAGAVVPVHRAGNQAQLARSGAVPLVRGRAERGPVHGLSRNFRADG